MRIKRIILITVLFFSIRNAFAGNEEDLLPLAVGNNWSYKVSAKSSDDISLTLIEIITGTENIDGKEVFVSENKNNTNDFVNKKSYFYKENGQLVLAKLTTYEIASRGRTYERNKLLEKGDVIEKNDTNVPMTCLRYPLKTGMVWISQGGSFTVLGKETITVPAGTFECWKISLEFKGETGTIYRYYSDHVGLVKDETIDPTSSFGSSVAELVEYKIKNL